jgi:dienelactone hydrolase
VRHSNVHLISTQKPFVRQGSDFKLQEWLPKHTPEHTGKRVRKVIDGLKEKGVVIYGATGYCYGGMSPTTFCSTIAKRRDADVTTHFCTARLVFDLAFDNVIHAAVISHPSLLKPEDLDVRHPIRTVDVLACVPAEPLSHRRPTSRKARLLS